MSTPDFEARIVDAIRHRVDQADGHLVVRLQVGGVPGPDVVVVNQNSGRSLAIEIKRSSGDLPLSFYPQLKRMNDECVLRGDEFVVLSDSPPSGVLQHSASTAHISIVQVTNPDEAMEVIEPKIRLLESR